MQWHFWMWINAQREHLLCQAEPRRQHPAHLLGSQFSQIHTKPCQLNPHATRRAESTGEKSVEGTRQMVCDKFMTPGAYTHTHSHTPNKEPANQSAAETQDSTKFVFFIFHINADQPTSQPPTVPVGLSGPGAWFLPCIHSCSFSYI